MKKEVKKSELNPIGNQQNIIKCINQNILKNYTITHYIDDVKNIGLEKTWNNICDYVLSVKQNLNSLLNVDNFAELYEIGLATQNKMNKKEMGKYYTPDDVASVMSQWLAKCSGSKVCDVACGTGKLILNYLKFIGRKKAINLIKSKNLYLYDCDKLALKICKTILAINYGKEIADNVNIICSDFLDKSVILPEDCKVISNPPYAKIKNLQNNWEHSDVLTVSKEFYSSFMDKIFKQSRSTVIITPFSFISGSKFFNLRKNMSELGNGHIVSFDNVPGNIFNGRKHGIFNSNTSNAVRAAITVFNKSSKLKGFKVSPLIRFKNEERNDLLKCAILEELLPLNFQKIDKLNNRFYKVNKKMLDVFWKWVNKSEYKVKDLITNKKEDLLIYMPNTCRYFTTASVKKLIRSGAIKLSINDIDAYYFLYCFINSSFAYWWWRIYDGGITYPISLLHDMPIPINLLDENDKHFFKNIYNKLCKQEDKYIIKKVNAGSIQENIKFPIEYRNLINKQILKILGYESEEDFFDFVHSNKFFNKIEL